MLRASSTMLAVGGIPALYYEEDVEAGARVLQHYG